MGEGMPTEKGRIPRRVTESARRVEKPERPRGNGIAANAEADADVRGERLPVARRSAHGYGAR
jgi:hypothetical protein